MDDKLKEDVEALVTSIFSEKEEADVRERTENALNKSATTIDELTETLESKNTELEESAGKVVELEEKQTSLETELEAARKETEEANEKLAEAEKALDEMKKDQATDERMVQLEEAGVVRSNIESQREKVREMDDDSFTSYKEELEAVRASVLKEIEDAAKKADEKTAEEIAAEEIAAEEKAAKEKADADDGEEGVETPPANISPGTAIAAAMNMEVKPSEEIVEKYKKLGKAMAAIITNKNEG